MSILSGFKKVRRRIRLPDGYKLLSFWTSSQTVEMDDGTTLESNKVKWDDASDKKHEHTNKSALDSITSEKVSKWDTLAESNVTGVKGNTESSYRTGNVNLTPANIGALPTTGGTLTGNISFNMNSSTQNPLKIYGGDANGQGISVGAGGATIVGGGESAKALESVVSATNEELHLASDNNIYFDVNCNTIANRLQIVLDKSRNFYPATNNTGSVGTSSYKWANMYATTFHGSLDGDASNANKLNGYSVTKWGGIPCIGTDGVMEIGKYIDFHNTNNNNDYDARLTVNTLTKGGYLTLSCPSSSNTLSIRAEGAWAGITTNKGWILYNNGNENIFSGTSDKAVKITNAPVSCGSLPSNLVCVAEKNYGTYTGEAYNQIANQMSDTLNSTYVTYTSSPVSGYRINKEGYYYIKASLWFSEITQTYEAVKRLFINLNHVNSTNLRARLIEIMGRFPTWTRGNGSCVSYIKKDEIIVPLLQIDNINSKATYCARLEITPLFIIN